MQVRPATPEDDHILSHLQNEYRVILSQSDSRLATLLDNPTDWNAVLNMKDQTVLVGVADDGRVIGYIHGQANPPSGMMVEMVLDAHRYHGGLGRLLWQHLKTWFDQHDLTEHLIRIPRYHPVEQAFWRALGATEKKEEPCPPEMSIMAL